MKKIIYFMLAALLLVSSIIIPISAKSDILLEDSVNINEGNLLPYPPNSLIQTQGAEKPTTLWNIANAQYDFDGSSNGSELYTRYYFAGKTSYTIHVVQGGINDIKIRCIRYSDNKVLETKTLSSDDSSITFTFSTKDSFYLEFHSPFLFIERAFKVGSGSYIK